ncbi:50S ribosomal protein L9 [Candidatus Babeliales bacterium]|nr:50S ribosomal protein L9 [Candidatus Babeliales bacterium]
MFVYMLKDVEKVGMAGQVVKVADGFARNMLIPKKMAIKVGPSQIAMYQEKSKKISVDSVAVSSKVGMLAERIRNMHVTVKERAHDDGKLYGAVGADEIVELLKEKDISINKKQVEFTKNIRMIGEHKAIIRLSSKLKPELTVKVVEKN